jgi:hypothetical protein
LFDARPYSFSFLKPSSFGFSFIYRLLNKVTHMQRFQTTFSFVDSFLSGQLKSKVREIKVKSPLLKRLDRKLRQRQARYNSLQTTTSKSNFNKYRKQNFNKRKFKSRFKPKFRKRRSPFSRLPREQRINELKNLFPFHFWLSYYHGSRLSSVYHKQLVLSFVQQMRIVLRILYRRGALVQSNKSLLKELLNLFETMLTILVLKTGDTSFINVINRLRASNNKDKLALEKSIFYFKWLLNFIRKVSLRRRTSRYSKKLSLTYL